MNAFLTLILALLGFTTSDVEQNRTTEPIYQNSRQQINHMEIADPTQSDDDSDIYRFNNGNSDIG